MRNTVETRILPLLVLSLLLSMGIQPLLQVASAQSDPPTEQAATRLWSETSPFNTPIPADATYTLEPRIGTFRHGYEEWSMPVYRLESSADIPLVTVTNRYSGRTAEWPIPTDAVPASASDGHMAVINQEANIIYEFWATKWLDDGSIQAGGMMSFPLDGPGISDPPHYRVTAAGFAVTSGMILREDFIDPTTGALSADDPIDHALTTSLPFALVTQGGYVSPAVGGETQGEAGLEGVPMGALLAVDPALDVDALDVHPFTRELLRAARDYGLYVIDTNGASEYNDLYVGSIRIEPGLIAELYGEDDDDLRDTVAAEVYAVLQDSGLYRVTVPGVDTTVNVTPSDTDEDSVDSTDSDAPRAGRNRGGKSS